MSNYKAIVGISATTNDPIEPNGLMGLKLSVEQENDRQFYRQKVSGGIEFSDKLFGVVKPLEGVCCQTVPFIIYRNCNNTQTRFLDTQFKTNQMEWDFELCSSKVPSLEVIDKYKGVYQYWEKKINLCSMARGKILEYTYRKPRTVPQNGSEVTLNDYIKVNNNRGMLFSEWILFAINKTFLWTTYESLTPATVAQMSQLFDRNINPCTGKQNKLRTALMFQASDLMFPQSTAQSTGLLEDGRVNEDVALSLKEILDILRIVFDIHWHIDSQGKFRLEHLSFYKNGLSYSQNAETGIDLREERFFKHLYEYRYSYKLDSDNLAGKEELKFTNNESIGKSKQAVVTPLINAGTEQEIGFYTFNKLDDFEYGNIKYLADCVSTDEKGEPKKKTGSDDKLITHFEAVRMADETVDVTKWVLLDVEEKPQVGEIGVLPQNQVYLVRSGICERTTVTVSNAGFSATSIMRDFHRWDKPFSKGLMNYNDTPSGLIGKGFVRDMFSVQKTKRLKRITIPFCCIEQAFNPYLPIILPNGNKASVLRAEYDFADETLSIDPTQNSSCGFDVQFPTENTGTEYPPRGTVLSVIEAFGSCPVAEWIDTGYGCLTFWKTVVGQRTIYADGNGGSYTEDVIDYESQCQNDPLC